MKTMWALTEKHFVSRPGFKCWVSPIDALGAPDLIRDEMAFDVSR